MGNLLKKRDLLQKNSKKYQFLHCQQDLKVYISDKFLQIVVCKREKLDLTVLTDLFMQNLML